MVLETYMSLSLEVLQWDLVFILGSIRIFIGFCPFVQIHSVNNFIVHFHGDHIILRRNFDFVPTGRCIIFLWRDQIIESAYRVLVWSVRFFDLNFNSGLYRALWVVCSKEDTTISCCLEF